ncbi:MAG: hypothetical protein AAGA90_19785 [Actinomycetota bacterium]
MKMKRYRTSSILIVAACVTAAGLAPAGAQPEPETTRFLPGAWTGTIATAGAFSVSGTRADGTTFAGGDLISASNSTFSITVDETGTVAGHVDLDVAWEGFGTGEAPFTGDSYDIRRLQSATGTLTVSGEASRLQASGPGVWDTTVFDTGGSIVEESSGPSDITIGVTYAVETADCASASGSLVAAEGTTILRTVPGSSGVQGSRTFTNELTSTFWAVPTFDDSAEVLESYIAIAEDLRDLLAQPADAPIDPAALLELIVRVEEIRSELARLDVCQEPLPDGWDDGSLKSFLDDAIAVLVARVFGDPGAYDVQQLISVLHLGVRAGAVGGDLAELVRTVLADALDDAIANDRLADVQAIGIAAAQYGFAELYEQAISYLEAAS